MQLESGDQIQLSDGKTYLFLFSLPIDDKEYYVFSDSEDDEVFRLGYQADGQQITFTDDAKLIEKVQNYVVEHADEI